MNCRSMSHTTILSAMVLRRHYSAAAKNGITRHARGLCTASPTIARRYRCVENLRFSATTDGSILPATARPLYISHCMPLPGWAASVRNTVI